MSGVISIMVVAGVAAGGALKAMPLVVEEPSGIARAAWLVTSGVPWPKGMIKDESRVVLRTSGARALPCQTRALTRWEDRSVKWLLLDFQTNLTPREKKLFALVPGKPRRSKSKPGEAGGWCLLRSGGVRGARVVKPARGVGIVEFRTGDGRRPVILGSVLVDSAGKEYTAVVSGLEMEEQGPMRSVLRVEGEYVAADDARLHSFVVRLHTCKGKSFVRLFHTLRVLDPTEEMASIRSVQLSLRVPDAKRFAFGGEPGLAGTVSKSGKARLFQHEDNAYRLTDGKTGKRAPGWAQVLSAKLGVTACVRQFWQQYPKAFSVESDLLHVELMPGFDKKAYSGRKDEDICKLYYYLRGGVYTFKVGVEKTHEVLLDFHSPALGPDYAHQLNARFQTPLVATASPEWVCATKVFGALLPVDKRYTRYDDFVAKGLEKHLARRERLREYGLINFGDWYGERGVNWGNLEYDLAHGLFLQYARTGRREYYDRAVEASQHHIDVDVVHCVNNSMKNPWGAPPKPGEIWVHCMGHTGGYFKKGFCGMTGSPYYMGYSQNMGHVWISGDLDYYHLTGDRRALETARLVGDAHARLAPGIHYGTHIRGHGWPMILLLAVYEETHERKYMDAAKVLANDLYKHERPEKGGWVIKLAAGHCKHKPTKCYGNVPFMVGVACSGLKRYHRLSGDERAARAIVKAVDQMVEECWIPEKKLFRYTACPLSPDNWGGLGLLMSEAIGYAYRVTGDQKYRTLLEETMQTATAGTSASSFGKGLAQEMVLAPYALYDLLTPAPK